MTLNAKLGIIAGNGRFPFLVLDAARAQGYAITVRQTACLARLSKPHRILSGY